VKIGNKVVIIGAGNVALDAARSIWRMGKEVTLVYRRAKGDMPANKDEILEAESEGIRYKFLAAPEEILTNSTKHVTGLKVAQMAAGSIDITGRPKPIRTGKTEIIDCDTVILAVGERVDSSFLVKDNIAVRTDGRLQVDPFTFQTSLPKVYAGGDAVSGPSTAAEAMGMAKKAAEAIDFYLMKEKRFHVLSKKFSYQNLVPLNPVESAKNISEKLKVGERTGNFLEVALGYTGEQAHNEVNRCLRCDVKC
jgi:NADPH-dependent glutamate synthase beta subunit-like oxidoreductase